MNTYEREAIGNIVVVRNMTFENTTTNKQEYDHVWNSGRPCIIIYSDNEYDYFLTMTSNTEIIENFKEQHFKINKKDLLQQFNDKLTKGAIKLENVYKMPICGHRQLAKVKFEVYKEILNKLKQYHQNQNLDDIIINAKSVRGR